MIKDANNPLSDTQINQRILVKISNFKVSLKSQARLNTENTVKGHSPYGRAYDLGFGSKPRRTNLEFTQTLSILIIKDSE